MMQYHLDKLLINLILFATQTRYVTLEDAANVLIGEEEEGQTKYKSKKLKQHKM